MKNECDIVKDLLFSYNDGVLSTTSKEFVEEHLKICESCNNTLKEIQQENSEINQEKEIDALKGVRKKITKKNIIISISLIFLLIIIIFNILIFANYNNVSSTMTVLLQENITEEQLENIKTVITENSSEVEIKYISKEDELQEIKEWLGDDANILDPYQDENNPFTGSLQIEANTNKEIQTIVEAIQDMPGIKNIRTYLNWNPYELFISQVIAIGQ